MKFRASLMPFESLIEYLSFHGFADRLDAIMKIKASSGGGLMQSQIAGSLPDEYREKFVNTWWQVSLPFSKSEPSGLPQCLYLADSLRDALRLRPDIDITFWPDTPKSFAEYLRYSQGSEEDTENCDCLEYSAGVQ